METLEQVPEVHSTEHLITQLQHAMDAERSTGGENHAAWLEQVNQAFTAIETEREVGTFTDDDREQIRVVVEQFKKQTTDSRVAEHLDRLRHDLG